MEILNSHKNNEVIEFLVLYKDYPLEDSTWEPIHNVDIALVKKYFELFPIKKGDNGEEVRKIVEAAEKAQAAIKDKESKSKSESKATRTPTKAPTPVAEEEEEEDEDEQEKDANVSDAEAESSLRSTLPDLMTRVLRPSW